MGVEIICALTGTIYSNFKCLMRYEQDFIDYVFQVDVNDISHDTFLGLERFIQSHRGELNRFNEGKWIGYLIRKDSEMVAQRHRCMIYLNGMCFLDQI
jgi:hypothetical protein